MKHKNKKGEERTGHDWRKKERSERKSKNKNKNVCGSHKLTLENFRNFYI